MKRRPFRFPWRTPERIRDDVDEEITFHLDMRTDELVKIWGMTPDVARARAEHEFGDLRRTRHELRRQDEQLEWWARWRTALEDVAHDLRFAVRGLRRRPAFSGFAVLTISLGIAAITLVFTIVDGVLLRPLPYPEPDRLVHLWQTNEDWLDSDNPMLRAFARRFPASYPVYEDWRSTMRSVETVGAYAEREVTIMIGDRPERLRAIPATAGVFDALAVPPAIGRVFSDREDDVGGPALAVLSHGLWWDRFGGDPEILDRPLVLDGAPFTVVGIMPSGFYFPDPGVDLWLTMEDEIRTSGRGRQGLSTIAKLRDGVDLSEARRELREVTLRIAEAHPGIQGPLGAVMAPRLDEVVGESRASLILLFAASILLLLVACLNVMNMLFVRATLRGREIAVRAALGAGKGRLARSMLAESVVLVLAGGGLGVLTALSFVDPLIAMLPASVPRAAEIAVDGRVVAFAVAAILAAALVAGLVPALIAARARLGAALQTRGRTIGGSRRMHRVRSALVVTELAAAVVLLVAAGLLGRSLQRLNTVDPGFRADGVVVAEMRLPESLSGEAAPLASLYELVRESVSRLPGVESVGFAQNVPFFGGSSSGTVEVERVDGERVTDNGAQAVVSDGYFESFQVPILLGRGFDPGDRAGARPVVVVSRAFAERHWAGADPIGRLVRDPPEEEWRMVVGVAGDVRHGSLTAPPVQRIYRPLAQTRDFDDARLVMAVRTDGDPAELAGALRAAVWDVAPAIPIPRVAHLTDLVGESIAEPRLRTLLIGALALLAALLAIAGVYGLVSFSVATRTEEMGVRMAVGASPERLTWEVVASGLRLGGLGVLLGVPAALASSRALRGFLFDVSPADPIVLGGAAALVVGTAALAALLPARRTARVDPSVVLRME